MKAIDIMTKNPVFLKTGDTIRQAVEVLEREGMEAAPVLDSENRPVGLFSRTHLVRIITGALSPDLAVREVMSAPVFAPEAGTSLDSILSRDPREDLPILPITNDTGRLTGVITREELHQALRSQLEQTQDKLNTMLESIGAELKVTNELNKELDAIIDSVYEGLYITDGAANTLRINKAYTRMTGIRPEEVIGKNMKSLVEKGIYSESVTLHVLERKEPVTILHQIKGTQKCLITGNPIFNDQNEIIRVVTTVRDVTELNKLEKKLEAAEDISQKYHLEIQHLRQQQMQQTDLVEHSAAMKRVLALSHKAAQVDSTVLISGATGVGKEMIAKFIHKNSPRREAPFINVNCAAIPETLLESELFGYEKGAFTGARNTGKPGMFELADTGTIFLDEIGDLPHNLQAKLLRVLQDKAVLRIGGTKPKQLDVRILAASNLELEKLVAKGAFRQDFYYRLNVIRVVIPPLNARREEIPYLAKHFLERYNRRHGQQKRFSDSAIEALMQHAWPGNVRELKNLVERLVVIGAEDVITRDQIIGSGYEVTDALPPLPSGQQVLLKDAVAALEQRLISNALAEKGSTRKAARWLGVSQPTVIRKARRYGIGTGADS